MHGEAWIPDALADLDHQGLRRTLRTVDSTRGHDLSGDRSVINLASNDYLDLAHHPEVQEGAIRAARQYGAGATASRHVTGSLDLHEQLEQQLARHKGKEAALVFGSGYMANAGIVSALVGKGDRILADRLSHASLIDAAFLSGARLQRFRHNDPTHLADRLEKPVNGRTLIVAESVYSMDGDLAPLPEIAALARDHDALLLIDEAHATGVFGPSGRGRIIETGCEDDVNLSMGTLSKALGGYGGFVACSRPMRDWLVQKARSLMYTTAPPPPVVGSAIAALDLLDRHPAWGRDVLRAAAELRGHLRDAGLETGPSRSQIIPIHLGTPHTAVQAAARLRERGLLMIAMRPPTVPPGTSRLRLSLTRAHLDLDLREIAETIAGEIARLDPAPAHA